MTITAADVATSLGITPTPRPPRVPDLPADVLAQLKQAHDRRLTDGFDPLYLLVGSLRAKGWSLAAIAQPLGVTRESVRLWANHARERGLPSVSMPEPPPLVTARDTRARDRATLAKITARSREQKVLDDLLPRLRALQDDAQSLRGPSATNPDKAKASAEYTALLDEAIRRGVRPVRLARELDIRTVTIYARLRRGGYRPATPSEPERPSWADGPLVRAS